MTVSSIGWASGERGVMVDAWPFRWENAVTTQRPDGRRSESGLVWLMVGELQGGRGEVRMGVFRVRFAEGGSHDAGFPPQG